MDPWNITIIKRNALSETFNFIKLILNSLPQGENNLYNVVLCPVSHFCMRPGSYWAYYADLQIYQKLLVIVTQLLG